MEVFNSRGFSVSTSALSPPIESMMRIVLFDSDKSLIDLLSERSKKCGVTLDVFADVEQAFAAVKENPDSVDVVLISREMPAGEEAGFALTKMLRADQRTLEVPFIVLSSLLKNTDFALHQKSEDGANAYLKKPATLQQVIKFVLKKIISTDCLIRCYHGR